MIWLLALACTGPPAPWSTPTPVAAGWGVSGSDTPSDDPCGAGPWGDVQGDVFVDASAHPEGDGSRAAPFQTIGEAIAASREADVIAIADGTYAEYLAVADRDLTLAGRCAERVTLTGLGGTGRAIIGFDLDATEADPGTGTLRLSGLTLADNDGYGLRALGGSVEVRNVVVRDIRGRGLQLLGVDGTLEDLAIVDGGDDGDGDHFGALEVWAGSRVSARGLTIDKQVYSGIYVIGADTFFELHGGEITGASFDRYWSVPVEVARASVRLHDLRVADGEMTYGLYVTGSVADVAVEGLVIEHMAGVEDWPYPNGGPALAARGGLSFDGETDIGEGGHIVGSDVRITDCPDGLWALEGGLIDLRDVVVSDLGGDNALGGLTAATGGRIALTDATVEGGRGRAVNSFVGGDISLTDTEIRDTQPGGVVPTEGVSSELAAMAVVVEGDARATLTRTRITGAQGAGLAMWRSREDDGTPTVYLSDVSIEDVVPSNWARSAEGLFLREGSLVAEGLTVRDIAGPGIVVASPEAFGGDLRCTDCRIEDVALAGIAVVGSAPVKPVTVDGCTIDRVEADPSSGLSVGVLATHYLGPPSLELSGCEISGTAHGALVVSGEAAVQVRDSTLHGGSGALVGGTIPVHGNAVYATGVGPWDGENGLLIDDSTLVPGAGETVLLHAASATLAGITWEGGALRQQHCEGTAPVVGAEQADEVIDCPETDVLVLPIDPKPVGFSPLDTIE